MSDIIEQRGKGDAGIPDEELIQQFLQQKNPAAFDAIMLRYQDMVYRICYRMLGDHDDALDVSQEIFVTCYRKIHQFSGKSKLSTWLYRMSVNHCKNLWRKQKRSVSTHAISIDDDNPGEDRSAIQIADNNPDPREHASDKEMQNLVMQKIHALKPEFREILILRYSEELSYEEIAEISGCTIGTIKSRLNRARQELRMLLRGFVDVKT